MDSYLNFSGEGYIDYTHINLKESDRNLPFNFEIHDWKRDIIYLDRNPTLPLLAISIYLITIFGLEKLMSNRPPFSLKIPLFFWNGALGIMSILGLIRMTPLFIQSFAKHDFHHSICTGVPFTATFVFWSKVFVYSKYWELGDTVFLVLRKKPLTFLQWGHHSITLLVVWLTTPLMEPMGRYFIFMNYGVHSLMYPYFALSAVGVRIPRKVANLITTLQLAQMIVGLFINSYTAYYYYSDVPCNRHISSIRMFTGVYGLFVFLFGRLFYNLVLDKSKNNKKID